MRAALVTGPACLYQGDAREVLKKLPSASAQCCITSPPYWQLRDYGCKGQIGLEDSVEEYVAALLEVFEQVRRVLSINGTLWLNMGDKYIDSAQVHAKLKARDLAGLPWQLALALREQGWYLRSDIIWSKPNPLPESVQDRPTRAHEYLFLLSKSANYFYDAAAIREPARDWPDRNKFEEEWNNSNGFPGSTDGRHRGFKHSDFSQLGRNKRSVWEIPTACYPDAHFATFPEKLVTPCILAGSREGDVVLDPFAGSGTTLAVARKLGRRSIGIELQEEYLSLMRKRLLDAAMPLFELEEAG